MLLGQGGLSLEMSGNHKPWNELWAWPDTNHVVKRGDDLPIPQLCIRKAVELAECLGV